MKHIVSVVVYNNSGVLSRVSKQTSKLEETINVTALKEEDSVCRELILVKVVTTGQFDNSIVQLADEFGALILDITSKSMILELTGTSRKIDNFAAAISDLCKSREGMRVKNVCRTGITAIDRGV